MPGAGTITSRRPSAGSAWRSIVPIDSSLRRWWFIVALWTPKARARAVSENDFSRFLTRNASTSRCFRVSPSPYVIRRRGSASSIRLVVDVRRGDPLQDANQERRTAHEPGASRDVESEVHPRGLLLADIRSNLPCDLQEIIGVADLDRRTRDPQPSAKFHDLGPSVPALRMITVVERNAVEMARRPDRREQALWPPAKGAEKHGHAPCSPSSNNKKFLPSNPATIRCRPERRHGRNHFIVLLR